MLELKVSAPELKEYAKSIPKIKDQLFDLMRLDVKQVASDFLDGLMQAEFELFLERDKYERQSLLSVTERNYRNGHYQRSVAVKGLGKLALEVPRDRKGKYKTGVLDRYQSLISLGQKNKEKS